jgi:hypothetical protein
MLSSILFCWTATASPVQFDYEHLASVQTAHSLVASTDGSHVAYQVATPRRPGVDEDGGARATLYLTGFASQGPGTPFLVRDSTIQGVSFSPDNHYLMFLEPNGVDDGSALWAMPVDGGEPRQVLHVPGGISAYAVHADLHQIAVVGPGMPDESRQTAQAAGYIEEVFEEDVRSNHLWITTIPSWAPVPESFGPSRDVPLGEPLTLAGSPRRIAWAMSGDALAVVTSPTKKIDDIYMASSVHLIDPTTGAVRYTAPTEGKLGAWTISPSGKQIALITSVDPYDPAAGRLSVGTLGQPGFCDVMFDVEGYVFRFTWTNDDTILFLCFMGVENEFG